MKVHGWWWCKKWLSACGLFMLIDAPWIYWVVLPMYRARFTPEQLAFRVDAALVFYIVFISGLLFFTYGHSQYRSARWALLVGFAYGLATYATYACTCLAVFSAYDYVLAICDALWGGVLSALITAGLWWMYDQPVASLRNA